jgi:hypothetical protein
MRCLNEFHRRQHLLSKQMEKGRSEMPPTSPRAFIDQVNRLRRQSLIESNARSQLTRATC